MDIKKEEGRLSEEVFNHLSTGFSGDDAIKFEPFVPSEMSAIPSQMTEYEFDQYFPIPDEFLRPPSGSSVIDRTSVTDDSGRTFHGSDGKYMLPNDAAEQDRLDFQHKMISLVLDGRLALAPMKKTPKYVLDVGCGTGIWAIDWAHQNPDSFVIGTDISAIQPDNHPANCDFIKDDAEKEWLYPQVPAFDYIHLRFLALAFNNPTSVLTQAVKSLAPGGWVEYHETSPTRLEWVDEVRESHAIIKMTSLFEQALIMGGRETRVAEKYETSMMAYIYHLIQISLCKWLGSLASVYYSHQLEGWMHDAGLVEIVEQKFILPLNTWPQDKKLKRIGQYMCADVCDGARGASWKMLKAMDLSPADIEQLVTDFKNEAKDERNRIYWTMHVVYGRKPVSGEV